MNRISPVLFLALLFTASTGRGQGSIYFLTGGFGNNFARVTFQDGTPVGVGFTAQLYGGIAGTAVADLQPLYPAVGFHIDRPELLGYVGPIIVDIPTVSLGEKATVVMRAYSGPDWMSGGCRGESAPIDVLVGTPAGIPGYLIGLQPFSVDCVPEPSPVPLLVVAGLAMRLGRCFIRGKP